MIGIDTNLILDGTGKSSYSGAIAIGIHLGEEVDKYIELGCRNVLCIDANDGLLNTVYENVKFKPIRSQFLGATLDKEDGIEKILEVRNKTSYTSTTPDVDGKLAGISVYTEFKKPVITKKFSSIYRENNASIDLSRYDFIRISTNGTELDVLKGFDRLIKIFDFKTINIVVHNNTLFSNSNSYDEINVFMSENGYRESLLINKMYFDEVFYNKI